MNQIIIIKLDVFIYDHIFIKEFINRIYNSAYGVGRLTLRSGDGAHTVRAFDPRVMAT